MGSECKTFCFKRIIFNQCDAFHADHAAGQNEKLSVQNLREMHTLQRGWHFALKVISRIQNWRIRQQIK